MTTLDKVADLLNRNFLLMANWQGQDRHLTDVDTDGYVTLLDSDNTSRLVPLSDVADIGFASRLVPDRYLPIDDYDRDLASRFGVFCQLTDLSDATASELLGRPVRLDELAEPNDWKAICAGLVGL